MYSYIILYVVYESIYDNVFLLASKKLRDEGIKTFQGIFNNYFLFLDIVVVVVLLIFANFSDMTLIIVAPAKTKRK